MEFNKIKEEKRTLCSVTNNEIDKMFSQKCFCISVDNSSSEKVYKDIILNKMKWNVLYNKENVYFILYSNDDSLFKNFNKINKESLYNKNLLRNPTPGNLTMMVARSFLNENFI